MIPIKYNPKTKVFTLSTRSSMYQMQIERYMFCDLKSLASACFF